VGSDGGAGRSRDGVREGVERVQRMQRRIEGREGQHAKVPLVFLDGRQLSGVLTPSGSRLDGVRSRSSKCKRAAANNVESGRRMDHGDALVTEMGVVVEMEVEVVGSWVAGVAATAVTEQTAREKKWGTDGAASK
jgi:hypothetical protein